MAELYLSRKSDGASSSISGDASHNWSPTIGSKISRATTTTATTHVENDVEELEMLLEVINMIH